MSAVSGQAKPAHLLVQAIRRASTPFFKGEMIHLRKWYLNLSPEPTPPAKSALWNDIRSSGLGEELLDIVTNGGEDAGPFEALYHIVRNIRATWNKANSLETALREKVMAITCTLARLERHKFKVPDHLAFARKFAAGTISQVMEKLRWDFQFVDGLQNYQDSLLQMAFTCLFDPAHSAEEGEPKPDPSLIQHSVVITAILADNFGFSNNVSETTISRYGTRQIVKRFQLILKDPEYRDSKLSGMLSGMSAVMLHLWVDARIRHPLVIRGQIHDLMMNRFWEYQINRPDGNITELGPCGLNAVYFLCDIVQYGLEVHADDSLLEKGVLQKLILGHDLFFAFGMILAGSEKYGCVAKATSIDGFIALVLRFRLTGDDLQFDYAVQAWLHVMACLRRISSYRGPLTFRNSNKENILTLEVWEKFGKDLGLDETETRAAIQAKHAKFADNEITCAKIKCPLFGESILGRLASPLRCTTCRSMAAASGHAKPAHALVNAIRDAPTPWHKGEVIHQAKWCLDLALEPAPPENDNLWSDIRSSGLGEVLLDIILQGGEGGPIDIGEVHLQISSFQALYHIVRNIRVSWDNNKPFEVALREKVLNINQTLVRLEGRNYEKPSHIALAREFCICIICPVMEKFRWESSFIFDDARSTGRHRLDPTLLQNAVIIAAVLADNFGFPNNVAKFIVSRYGIRKIIDRLQLVLKDPAYRDSTMGGVLTGMSAVVLHLWSDDRIRRPLVIDGRIHELMMGRFWEYQIDRPDEDLMELGPSGLSAVSFLCDMVEYIVEVEKEDCYLAHEVFRRLILDHDLFLAFGMILAGEEKSGCFARGEF
ncbi:hypothetical protein FRC01_009332 [Tulasnella sp. 417]|nr:hypothetical protein FRC01_009332 [Tulasnella sp. 417]